MPPSDEEHEPRPHALSSRVHDGLLDSRTVLIFGEITAELARDAASQLLALASASADPIRVLINSQGGHVESGDTVHDVIRFVEPEVTIIGTGWVASAGALIYVAVDRERRLALPNTRFLLHQPIGGARGPVADLAIEAAQIVSIRERLNRRFAEATGQPVEKIERETRRNLWMNAAEALEYGLVGRIIERMADV